MLYHLVVALCVAAAAAKPGGDKPGGDAKAKCGELAQAAFACLDAASAMSDCTTQVTVAKECFENCEKEGKGPRGPPRFDVVFAQFDMDGDGFIDRREFKLGLQRMGFNMTD